ncbi:hypothetical protein HNQ99_002667 [Rhizorhapis suberifaciens]|uniref:Uncharacterized protein n=1 Tax=Rhizorhapis suberifaciens TaxID=13656 RepID=A0A840HVM6_9SPHN|nr:hypothetical protein [Rhizorhapis suberifaciens]
MIDPLIIFCFALVAQAFAAFPFLVFMPRL